MGFNVGLHAAVQKSSRRAGKLWGERQGVLAVFELEGPPRQRVLTWRDVDMLIDHLLPQLNGPYDALLMITRGGIIPGGLIGEALDVRHIVTASVRFSTDLSSAARMFAWPEFIQSPQDDFLERKLLADDDVDDF